MVPLKSLPSSFLLDLHPFSGGIAVITLCPSLVPSCTSCPGMINDGPLHAHQFRPPICRTQYITIFLPLSLRTSTVLSCAGLSHNFLWSQQGPQPDPTFPWTLRLASECVSLTPFHSGPCYTCHPAVSRVELGPTSKVVSWSKASRRMAFDEGCQKGGRVCKWPEGKGVKEWKEYGG